LDYSELVSLKEECDGDFAQKSANNGSDYWTTDEPVATGAKRGCEVEGEEEPQQKQLKTESDGAEEADGAAGPSDEVQCKDCKVQYKDPEPFELIMYLHAYKYQVRNRSGFFLLIRKFFCPDNVIAFML
jgi:hypothetical protein